MHLFVPAHTFHPMRFDGIEGIARKRSLKMLSMTSRMLFWTPRVLGILFALFISIFALDVFGAGYSIGETIIALFMHLIPVFVLLIGIALSWRWEWIGALVFIAFGAWYVSINRSPDAMFTNLIIAGPTFVVGALYLVDWLYRASAKRSMA
jgi:hypothetical protein